MKDNNNLVVYKENIFIKIKNFIKNIFFKKERNEEIEIIHQTSNIGERKNKFNEYISFNENKKELDMINQVRKNPEILKKMTIEELDNIEIAIINRQNFINKKIKKLKTDLYMKKNNI